MVKLKKAILALGILLALALSLNIFTGDAQTRAGGATQNPARPKMVGLPPKPGVDYSKFDHTIHSLKCEECHVNVNNSERVTKFPGHAACQECHAFPQFTVYKGAAFCLVCHETQK